MSSETSSTIFGFFRVEELIQLCGREIRKNSIVLKSMALYGYFDFPNRRGRETALTCSRKSTHRHLILTMPPWLKR
jgi:hypothetical protein